jgi:hypothetical protein
MRLGKEGAEAESQNVMLFFLVFAIAVGVNNSIHTVHYE